MIGGRNKYLINGVAAQPSRVQNMFHSVQLNVNNPHFLIMQGRITKVLRNPRLCSPPPPRPLPATRRIQEAAAADHCRIAGWVPQHGRLCRAAATAREDQRTGEGCPVLSRLCRRLRPCTPQDALAENDVLLQSCHHGVVGGVGGRPHWPATLMTCRRGEVAKRCNPFPTAWGW